VYKHIETPFKTDVGIINEREDCNIGTGWGKVPVVGGR
jgi:hypothetical protein